MSIKTPVPVNELSIDVDSAIASAATDTAPDTADEVDSSESDTDVTPPSKFFGQNEAEEDAQDEPAAEDEPSDAEDYWEVPANGQVHKVNMREKEKVKRLLSMGLAGPKAFSKVASLTQENKRLTEEIKSASSVREKAQLFDKLEAIKDNEDELYRVITGGKSLEDVVKARIEKTKLWEEATPEERMVLESKERERQLMTRVERMEASAKAEKEEAARQNAESQEKQAYSIVYPEYQSILKSMTAKISDPVEAQEVASDLWELGWARIQRMQAEAEKQEQSIDLTPAFVRKVFESTAKRWGYTATKQAKAEVSKILDKKSKEATKKAGMAATRNYKARNPNDLAGLSPTKAFEKLFGR